MLKNLCFAALTLGCIPAVHAQSAVPDPGQQILYTAPDGETSSNAPLPSAQAIQPQEVPDSLGSSMSSLFSLHAPAPPQPLMAPPPFFPQNNSQRRTDDRKRLSMPTAAQIMGVPTLRQIFGLPDSPDSFGQGYSLSSQNANTSANPNTNNISFGSASSTQPVLNNSDWAQLFSNATNAPGMGMGQGEGGEGGIFGGLFNQSSAPSSFGHIGSHGQNPGFFGSSPPVQAAQQSSWGALNASAPVGGMLPQSPAIESPAGSGLNSLSPFALPQSPVAERLPQLPALPKLPQLPGEAQNRYPTPAGPPSWAPKPPPWLSSQPTLGTMEPRKF